MKNKLFISFSFSILLFLPTHLLGQGIANNWYFGQLAGIHFSTAGTSALFNGSMNTLEGCVSYSDASGKLLFYSNGVSVWDKTHQVMPNGAGLMGHISSSQSVAVAPWPGIPGRFFLFTVDERGGGSGLRYSLLDMGLNGGLGDIFQKNTPIESAISEKISIIRHANNEDYWVVTHKYYNNEFFTYRVSRTGLDLTPVTSAIGVNDSTAIGQMKASIDGSRIVRALRTMNLYELYDFDRSSGQVSNPITFPDVYNLSYGAEFSPDGTKLYIHSSKVDPEPGQPGRPSQLIQVDLEAGSPGGIVNSATPISVIGVRYPGSFQLGPDGQIYVARLDALYLGVIQNPNESGIACNYADEGLYLGGRKSQFGLPAFAQHLVLPTPDFTFEGTCFGDSTRFQAANLVAIDSIAWNFDDPATGTHNQQFTANPAHLFSASGDFTVQFIYFRGSHSDTITKTFAVIPLPEVDLGQDTILCAGQFALLDAQHISTSQIRTQYTWHNGITNSSQVAEDPGLYWVEVSNVCGTVRDSIHVSFRESLSISLGKDTLLCEGQPLELSVQLSANDPDLFYLWSTFSTGPTLPVISSGEYWVQVKDRCGATRDTVSILFDPLPVFDLGSDTTLCIGEELVLPVNTSVTPLIQPTYLWNDGSTQSTLTVTQPGTYSVLLSTRTCEVTDEIQVNYLEAPEVTLPADTILCPGQTLLLDASTSPSDYLWQDGKQHPRYLVFKSGNYAVIASNTCGISMEEINVVYHEIPTVDLGTDTVLCPYKPIVLHATSPAQDVTYRWQDGFSGPAYTTRESGVYHVSVENRCGTARDSVSIRTDLKLCDCNLFVPNVFTPNADGINDRFVVDYPCYLSRFQLSIYDRWGSLIYETTQPERNWDGTYKQNSCPPGIYFYVLSYKGHDGKMKQLNTLKGAFTLLR